MLLKLSSISLLIFVHVSVRPMCSFYTTALEVGCCGFQNVNLGSQSIDCCSWLKFCDERSRFYGVYLICWVNWMQQRVGSLSDYLTTR
jgi:hypothetical protein